MVRISEPRKNRRTGKTNIAHFEDAEQKYVIQWAELEPLPAWMPRRHPMTGESLRLIDFLYAVPNGGGKLGPKTGSRLKEMGLKPGVSDLVLAIPAGPYHGLYVEMKRQRRHFKNDYEARRAWGDKQRGWAALMELMGYQATVAYGWDECREIVLTYLQNGKPGGAAW